MKTPKVSIIITVYNLEELLSSCLLSCVNQTYSDIEIVVINDGSTDKSGRIINEFAANDNRIIEVFKLNEGVNFARKAGIEKAKGDYLFFLDGDDTIPLNAVEVLIDQVQLNEADIIAGSLKVIDNGSILEERHYSSFGSGSGIEFLEFILTKHLHYLCGKLIKRTLYTENRIDVEKELIIGEDQVQLFQLCMVAEKVATTDKCVYNYIYNSSSTSQKKTSNEVFSSRQELYANALFELQQRFPFNDLIRQQINFRILTALNLALYSSGRYLQDQKRSSKIMAKTLANTIFTRGNLLWWSMPSHTKAKKIMDRIHNLTLRRRFDYFVLLMKSCCSLIFPGIFFKAGKT